ncbi:porin family protein [Sphingobium bisphenolivorans]|uniref:porin family protein n=1 Tax=Sphingobium bisphenolivorans TaxID=1335760 RepID=UPI0003AA7D28|nr:porin family protein [Sphingobium bisphenolivorans]
MKKLVASALLLASIAAPAMAQDAVPFSGPYVAGVVGLDHVDFNGVDHDSGLLYGGIVGYDVNINGAVFGIEGEYADSDVKEQGIHTDRDLYAGIRIGGEVVPNVLAYAKGGYTNARFEDNAGFSAKLDGYRLGAGLETTFQGFITRAEYRYSSYEGSPERHQAALILGYRF